MKDRIEAKLASLQMQMTRQLDTCAGTTPEVRVLVAMIETMVSRIVAIEITLEDLIARQQPASTPALDPKAN